MLTAVTVLTGDEAEKGCVIDSSDAEQVSRCGCPPSGGNNAGRTVVTTQGKFVLNLSPGILHPGGCASSGTEWWLTWNIFPGNP